MGIAAKLTGLRTGTGLTTRARCLGSKLHLEAKVARKESQPAPEPMSCIARSIGDKLDRSAARSAALLNCPLCESLPLPVPPEVGRDPNSLNLSVPAAPRRETRNEQKLHCADDSFAVDRHDQPLGRYRCHRPKRGEIGLRQRQRRIFPVAPQWIVRKQGNDRWKIRLGCVPVSCCHEPILRMGGHAATRVMAIRVSDRVAEGRATAETGASKERIMVCACRRWNGARLPLYWSALAVRPGARSSRTVGMSSDTVGWIGTAQRSASIG